MIAHINTRPRALHGNCIETQSTTPVWGWPALLWPLSLSLSSSPDLHLNCITPALQHIAFGSGWDLDGWGKTSSQSYLSYTRKACHFPYEPFIKLEWCGSTIVHDHHFLSVTYKGCTGKRKMITGSESGTPAYKGDQSITRQHTQAHTHFYLFITRYSFITANPTTCMFLAREPGGNPWTYLSSNPLQTTKA